MKKLLFTIAFLAISSITFAQGISVKYQRQEPAEEITTGAAGVKSTFYIYQYNSKIGEIYVYRYDNGGLEIENGTNRYVKASYTTFRKGQEYKLGPDWLGPENGNGTVSVSQFFGGARFKGGSLTVHKIK